MSTIHRLFFFILVSGIFSACNHKNFATLSTYKFQSETGKPDYSDMHYWAAHPWKWDPSDSIPNPMKKKYLKDSLVDVFFLSPTTFTAAEDTAWNASIDDAALNAKTDYSAILYQASVFAEKTRVFAPRYRQAHYRAFSSVDKKRSAEAFALAYADIKNAFDYYLKYYNNGRAIIIASHSQGTLHAAHLLKDYFDGKELQKKLVAAYTIGLPVQENNFTNLKACSNPSQTGCIISWRTYEKGYEGEEYIAREKFNAININPLTFLEDTLYAPADKNIGGMLRNFNKLIPGLTDAQVHKNILWASKPKFFGNVFLNFKNYHIADYNLFYSNIQQDVKNRIILYLKQYK